MEFKVTTEFEGRTLSGEISGKGVQLKALLAKEFNTYVPLNILEDLVEELQEVIDTIKKPHTQGFEDENENVGERTANEYSSDDLEAWLASLSNLPFRMFDIGLDEKTHDEQQFIKQLLETFKDAVRVK